MTASTSAVAVCCCKRLGEIVGALAQFFQQPHILDRDDGLVGKAVDEFDLFVGERLTSCAIDRDGADQASPSTHIGTPDVERDAADAGIAVAT